MSNRFRRFGRKVDLDEIIKDCRDLDALVTTQSKLIDDLMKTQDALLKRIEVLEGGP
jgi:hypothetical protein